VENIVIVKVATWIAKMKKYKDGTCNTQKFEFFLK